MAKGHVNPNSIAALPYYLDAAAATHTNLALCGAHGRGKTSVVAQYAEENGYDLVTVILSQLTPEDMIGIPVVRSVDGNQVTEYTVPDWLLRCADPTRKTILFLDELTNADDDTFAAILSLLSERKTKDVGLADTTVIVCAFNPPEIAPNARVLAPAVRDRLCVIPILDDEADYLAHYETVGMDMLVDAIKAMPDFVTDYADQTRSCAYENAGYTWRSLEKSYLLFAHANENGYPREITKAMLCGFGGPVQGAALAENLAVAAKRDTLARKVAKAIEDNPSDVRGALEAHGIRLEKLDYATLKAVAKAVSECLDADEFKKFVTDNFSKEFIVANADLLIRKGGE